MTEIENNKQENKNNEAFKLQEKWKSWAEPWKVAIQMIIGLVIIFVLFIKIFLFIFPLQDPQHQLISSIRDKDILILVAIGLAYSAGIELAYMLLTPGPDEAIDPLILGLSSATLITISNTSSFSSENVLAVAVFTAAICALLWVRKKLL